ncbi:unnamed protein product [Laminaria digitata]
MIKDLSFTERPAGLDPVELGAEPFLLRSGCFSVIDGDTIWAWATTGKSVFSGDKSREKSFSMRFRSIAAPEKPKRRGTDVILKRSGVDPAWDSAGKKATDLLKTYLDKRALLVEPTGRKDKYGRLLCDLSVVPYSAGEPDLQRAISLEHLLLDQGVVNPFQGETRPQLKPRVASYRPAPS